MAKARRPRQYCGVPGCGKSFDRPAKLLAHQRSHSGEKPFQCPLCGKKFAQKKHLQVHELQHLKAEDRPFVCAECSKGFVSKQHYERHIKIHEPTKSWRCPYCFREFIQEKSYDTHMAKHRVCSICNRVCKNERELTNHMMKWHSKRFHCSECPSRFDAADELRKHVKQHHTPIKEMPSSVAFIVGMEYEQRNIVCPLACGQRFRRNYDLQRHMKKVHTTT